MFAISKIVCTFAAAITKKITVYFGFVYFFTVFNFNNK